MFFNDWLSRRVLYTPESVAVVDDFSRQRYTYRDLNERADRVGHFLQNDLDVHPGDRVACVSGNRIEYLDLYFACGKIGAVLVPLNVRLPAAGVVDLLEDCRPKVLLHESAFTDIAKVSRENRLADRILPIDGSDRSDGARTLEEALHDKRQHANDLRAFEATESDTAMILYTSGTTGKAKGAMISYRQIYWNALNTIIGLQLTCDDVVFLNMPLYHTGGWHVLFTPLMLLGGSVVLQKRFDAARCNEVIGAEGITILFGVPTTMRMMLEADNFAQADFSSVRFAIFGGESCPLPVIEAYAERGIAMRQGYGLTEAGPNCFSLPGADSIRKQGSIGMPNFHVGTRLVKNDGHEAGVGEVGELWMAGPHLFSGYWNNPSATAATLRDGWLATGDLMKRDDEGYFYVVGRKKDMYVSGGENVYPAHVERVLESHEAVNLAAVIGVPDPRWGETGWAFVCPQSGRKVDERELLDWCKRQLATFQCPTRFIVMPELPTGDSGKIDKLYLKRRAQELMTQ